MELTMLNTMPNECLLASFAEWDPSEYLADYYARVEEDEQHTLLFLAQEFKKLRNRPGSDYTKSVGEQTALLRRSGDANSQE